MSRSKFSIVKKFKNCGVLISPLFTSETSFPGVRDGEQRGEVRPLWHGAGADPGGCGDVMAGTPGAEALQEPSPGGAGAAGEAEVSEKVGGDGEPLDLRASRHHQTQEPEELGPE